MATVYKAYDPSFEREVALKVLPREMLHDPQFRVRFEREAKMIASLEHPSIVPVYDVGQENEQPYFVMRYMTGGSLVERIRKGPLSIAEAARIMERLAPALDEAHRKGIIHRDLKPGNILFDRVGEPYISDFGIAKMTQTQSATVTGGAIIGTPAYMSPEQAQGDKLDGRSDVYALGVILFEMLTGRQPYESDTPMAVVVKQITEPIPHILDVNPNLPADVEVVIEKAMAKSRDNRFSTAVEFASALAAVSRGEAPTLARTTPIAINGGAAKTRIANKKDDPTIASDKNKPGGMGWLAWAGLVVVGLVVVGLLGVSLTLTTIFQPTPTQTATKALPTVPPTETDAPALPSDTPQPTDVPASPTPEIPTETPAPATPAVSAIGGAREVAFIANNEIWLMNLDGSNRKQLTDDRTPKSDLQWTPDGKVLVYISGKTIFTLEVDAGRFDTLMSFRTAELLDGFRISPDGKRIALSMNRELFVLPYDPPVLKEAQRKSQLVAIKGVCLSHTATTQAGLSVIDFRWSADSQKVAWLYAGVQPGDPRAVDMIRVMDISTCDPNKITRLDEFPGTRFTPEGYTKNPFIPDFDWDGDQLLIFNTTIRNSNTITSRLLGWGMFYIYNLDLRKATQLSPLGETCCYRDARWSPDGSHIFFAFQSFALGNNTKTEFYYVPFSTIEFNLGGLTPIPMPEGFFQNLREAPQPALRPIVTP